MILLAPSVLGADFKRLGEQIQSVDRAGADYIHLDVMDGTFVPSISFGMPLIGSVRGCTERIFDVHMMVEEPSRYVDDMKRAGADLICVHAEACRHLDRTIRQIKEAGLMAGAALNPAASLGLSPRIEVDGGITADNVRLALEAGADVIVAGSAVFGGDAAGNVRRFKEIFREFEGEA